MRWKFWEKKEQEKPVVLSAEVPDDINLELNTKEIPTIDLQVETRVVDTEVRKFRVEAMPPYNPPTDKEIIEALEFQDNYEAAYLIRSLKKENANLKRKLTILKKKL